MAELRIIGVRHHSPACARLVRHAIAAARPWAVLIEGPSDMNAQLAELLRPHALPIAIYSYCLPHADGATGSAHGSWAPFCAYSPEWVALQGGHALGAALRFIDLPAWDPAFDDVENRYSDHDVQVSEILRRTAIRHGFDSTDALWDHLFELTEDPAQLERDLGAYFTELRGELGERDGSDPVREAYMARWIDWARGAAPAGATVLVVCGGFHAPALHALAGTTGQTAEPEVPRPEPAQARTGSYLVPFSFHRLDAFTGYASGMPSPAYYQAMWDHGSAAAERMTFAAIAQLRRRGQRVSTADAIAATQLADGLARLRGHRVATRSDVLDGLAGALIKDALRAPPPWSTRAPLPPGTEPYLVEIMRAFCGDTRGQLAEGTARPPLVDDIERCCAAVGLAWREAPAQIAIDVLDPAAAARRRVLYRLRWLDLPGVALVAAADLRRGRTQPIETWRIQRTDHTLIAMIERAAYGATLEIAALARIAEQLRDAGDVVAIAALLERALLAGFHAFADRLCGPASDAAAREPSFAAIGEALRRLVALQITEPLPPGHGLAAVVRAVIERGVWLLDAIDGADARFDRAIVTGVAALRDALDLELPDRELLARACAGVWSRRMAADEAPPAVRGACLGALWTAAAALAALDGTAPHDYAPDAADAVRGIPSPVLGELLAGLFVLAREAFRDSALLDVVDARLGELHDGEFLATLPALRRAFAFFPPAERRELARRLVRRHPASLAPHDLLAAVADPEAVADVQALEARWFAAAARYRLIAEEP